MKIGMTSKLLTIERESYRQDFMFIIPLVIFAFNASYCTKLFPFIVLFASLSYFHCPYDKVGLIQGTRHWKQRVTLHVELKQTINNV